MEPNKVLGTDLGLALCKASTITPYSLPRASSSVPHTLPCNVSFSLLACYVH